MAGVSQIIRATLGGALLANAIPHGVNGISGRSFPTPFAAPPGVGLSAPWVNVAWSSLNAVAAALALRGVRRDVGTGIAFTAGATGTAVVLSRFFGAQH